MGHGWYTYYGASMASGTSLSEQVNMGRAFNSLFLEIPTMASNTQLYIQASYDSGQTFRRVVHPCINSSTIAANNDFAIASAVTNRMVPIPAGIQCLKIEATASVAGGVMFRILAADM